MLLKLSLYKFKLEYYNFRMLTIIPTVTTKNIVIEYTQKEVIRELQCFHYLKNQLCTKEDKKNAGGKDKKVIRHTENK